jgi:SAM-dependent methyltransferase
MLAELQELGWNVEGLDFDAVAVKNAQAKGVRVWLGTLVEQQFPDNCFDAIATSHLIEHLHDPIGFLKECYRILRPNGLLVLITPNTFSWIHKIFGSDWRGLEPPRHLYLFGASSLAKLVSQAGFSRVASASTPRGVNSYLASSLLKRANKVMPSTSLIAYQQVRAEVLGLIEWLRIIVNKESGEELLVTAVK